MASLVETAGHDAPLGNWSEYRKAEQERVEARYLDNLISVSGADIKEAIRISGLSPSRLYGLLNKYGRSLGSRSGGRGPAGERAEKV